MKIPKLKVHFTDNELIDPTNPVTVNLIGAGGTGSKVLTALLEMNHSLIELGHPGLQVRLWDDDRVTPANIGRQRFAACEAGLYKSVALINRVNRWSGTNWKAETIKFEMKAKDGLPENAYATIYITCVDSVQARFNIASMLGKLNKSHSYRDQPKYWIDYGNNQYTGQALLATIGKISQPKSKKYDTTETLPFVTEEFGKLLQQSEDQDDTPSCSLAEALEKQDLYINGSLAQMGCSLLWNLFRKGFIQYRGFFHHIGEFRTRPIPIT